MYEEERRISILNKIQSGGKVSVAALARKYDVSASTIRRDLTFLEDSGFIKRTHGGAILQGDTNRLYNYNVKKNQHITEKQRIGKKAAGLVRSGSTIFIGASTITSIMAEHLTAQNLTVATNSLDVFNALARKYEYNPIIIGGNYIHKSRAIEGMTSVEQIQLLHFHQAFLGANGISSTLGISTASEIEATAKRTVIKNSSEVYFLFEPAKFEQVCPYKIADLEDITAIVTDSALEEKTLADYEGRCRVILSGQNT